MTRRDPGGTPEETSGASTAAPKPPAAKPATAKPAASRPATAKSATPAKPAAKSAAAKSATPKPVGGAKPAGASSARPRADSFLAQRRGARGAREASAAPVRVDEETPEAVPEFESVSLGGEAEEPGPDRSPERAVQRARLQKEMEAAPFAGQIGLRLDYADNGVSRVRLPTTAGNTEPGPLEGGVVGAACVAAGHFAAASLASGVGIRLVEFKISVLGPVQGDLLAIGEVVRKGRTLVACRMEVVEDNDRVVAIGLGTYFLQHP